MTKNKCPFQTASLQAFERSLERHLWAVRELAYGVNRAHRQPKIKALVLQRIGHFRHLF